ncbi:phosphatase PAP2 family protein [Methylocella sp.]|uniref:phosphatase PAP2 family protein n=1 Tax=Methylocella sp. TaxID=1978226 RepID=UPI0035AF64FE
MVSPMYDEAQRGQESVLDDGSAGAPVGPASRWARSKRRLSSVDLLAVHFFSRAGRWRLGRASAVLISRLGNGWIYPILALMLVAHLGAKAPRVILAAGVNAGLLHLLYPRLKRLIARPRPFRSDARVASLSGVLDEHSFPSGHAMTLTGVLVPIVMVWPDCLSAAVGLLFLMGWARMATGHHYPSDVCAGAGIGFVISYPISVWALGV